MKSKKTLIQKLNEKTEKATKKFQDKEEIKKSKYIKPKKIKKTTMSNQLFFLYISTFLMLILICTSLAVIKRFFIQNLTSIHLIIILAIIAILTILYLTKETIEIVKYHKKK